MKNNAPVELFAQIISVKVPPIRRSIGEHYRVPFIQNSLFTYRIPAEFSGAVQVGQPVLVAWGKQQNLTGFITGLSNEYKGSYALKDITDLAR